MPWKGGLAPRPYKYKEKWKSGGIPLENRLYEPVINDEKGKKWWYIDQNRVFIVVLKGKFKKKVIVTSFEQGKATSEQEELLNLAEELHE